MRAEIPTLENARLSSILWYAKFFLVCSILGHLRCLLSCYIIWETKRIIIFQVVVIVDIMTSKAQKTIENQCCY